MFVFFKLQSFLLFALLFSSQLSASTVFKPLEVVASAKDFFQDIGEDIIHPVLDIFERYGKNNVMATVGTNVLEKDKIAPNNIGLKDKEKILFIFINTFINDEANVVANMFAKEMNSQSPYVDKSFGIGVELKSLSSVKKVIFITPFECVKLFDCKEDNSSAITGGEQSWKIKSLIRYLNEFDKINNNVQASNSINSLFKLHCKRLSILVGNVNKKIQNDIQANLSFNAFDHYKNSCFSDHSIFNPKFGVSQQLRSRYAKYKDKDKKIFTNITLPYQLFHTEIMYQVLVKSKKICPINSCILSGKLSCWSCDGFMKAWKDMETDVGRKHFVACSSVGLERSDLLYYTQKINVLSSYGNGFVLSNEDEIDYWLPATRCCYENRGRSVQYDQVMLFDNYHRVYQNKYDVHNIFCKDILKRTYCLDLSSINKGITCEYIELYYHYYFPMLKIIEPNIKYLYGELGKKHLDFLKSETSKIKKDSEIFYHNSILNFISKYAPHCLVEERYCKDDKNILMKLLFSKDVGVFSVSTEKFS